MSRLAAWWHARSRTVDCETCGRTVRRHRAVIVDHLFDTYDGPGLITATYCRTHAPTKEPRYAS